MQQQISKSNFKAHALEIMGEIESTRLPDDFHKDPADRMITALVRTLSLSLVTADEKIRNYKHVNTIW